MFQRRNFSERLALASQPSFVFYKNYTGSSLTCLRFKMSVGELVGVEPPSALALRLLYEERWRGQHWIVDKRLGLIYMWQKGVRSEGARMMCNEGG